MAKRVIIRLILQVQSKQNELMIFSFDFEDILSYQYLSLFFIINVYNVMNLRHSIIENIVETFLC